MSLARPFIQGTVANHNGATYFTPWGFDEARARGGLRLAMESSVSENQHFPNEPESE